MTDEEIEDDETTEGDIEIDLEFEDGPSETEVVDEDLDENLVIDDDLENFDAVATDSDDTVPAVVEEEDDDEPEASRPKARKVDDDEEEDDDDEDPDDVEADLDAILRDRLAASEDDDDEEESDGSERSTSSAQRSVGQEVVCQSCFLLVNPSQVTRDPDPRCPHCGELIDL